MRRLDPKKLKIEFLAGATSTEPRYQRYYTLTHSDLTGRLFLSIGLGYDQKKVSYWYTRLMRDEIQAEWAYDDERASLVVHCHVSGGFVFGTTGMRDAIFRRELPLALEAIIFGDRDFLEAHPDLHDAEIIVHLHASQAHYDVKESWGRVIDYL